MQIQTADELLFGWDPTPGIVSVWADRDGHALVWRRVAGQVVCERERFRPWLFAAHLDDLGHLSIERSIAALDSRAPISVRELDGPAEHCRFLITARSGRLLERTLLEGASRRLGRAVTSLYDLSDCYYRVGPVEQYLIASGRVSFRGLTFDDLHRMQIDFETTALDPQQGRIFMAAVRDNRGFGLVLEAPEADDEPALITQLCALVRERNPDIIENHNLFGFDLPFLEERARVHGLPLDLGRPEGPTGLMRVYEGGQADDPEAQRRHRYTMAGRELIDTLDAVRRHDFVTRDLPSHRLKDVARHFGIAAPERVYIAGAAILETYRQDPDLVRRYALGDVAEVDALSRRLAAPAFALAGMAPRRYERLTYAGPAMGILEPMLIRAYVRSGAAPPLPVTADSGLGPHAGGGLHLFAAGIAEHVVKADVASLYPSLMDVYAIGPACDRLGALLTLVRRLTELRLFHKQAARDAMPGSLDAGHHNALQAAMKLIINSAYGYMGAGSMALFADRHAADEVTRHGRAVLEHVVSELRQRGVALIEADTDGVYFAVPPTWDAKRERGLVAQVAATLPARIRLEYEGRYQAMFSHEVKNYALLTYENQLIVRGAALRSSRSEPFGERFLKQALGCLLRNDVLGVQAAFTETVTALRERQLSAGDVATRVRLTKTPSAYASARTRQREAAYEALLAAGRTDWSRGERVRHYRTSSGTHVWLPDAAEGEVRNDTAQDYDVDYYLDTLVTSYAGRLRKAFLPEDFDSIFRRNGQLGLFDKPIEQVRIVRIDAVTPEHGHGDI